MVDDRIGRLLGIASQRLPFAVAVVRRMVGPTIVCSRELFRETNVEHRKSQADIRYCLVVSGEYECSHQFWNS